MIFFFTCNPKISFIRCQTPDSTIKHDFVYVYLTFKIEGICSMVFKETCLKRSLSDVSSSCRPTAWQRSCWQRLWLTWQQSFRTLWRSTPRPSSPQSFFSQPSRLLLRLQLWSASRPFTSIMDVAVSYRLL